MFKVVALLWLPYGLAHADLKSEAPALVVDYYCHHEQYPNLWSALKSMKSRNHEVDIDTNLALRDLSEYERDLMVEDCLLPLLREHVRPALDEALLAVIKEADRRLKAEKMIAESVGDSHVARTGGLPAPSHDQDHGSEN